jgi:hypothetical protein
MGHDIEIGVSRMEYYSASYREGIETVLRSESRRRSKNESILNKAECEEGGTLADSWNSGSHRHAAEVVGQHARERAKDMNTTCA